ncbi:hypothetical protein ACPTKN_13385 [Enterococcus faecalis]|uniref:hypothetical protein n=1 Tax=Enterococcus faecalis TaxID=1351 RepID=UPI003CC5C041
MSEKQGFKLKKNQIIGASVAALLLIGGGSVYAVNSQKKAQAEKIELAEKKEKEDYKKLSLQVDDSVKKAYDTRSAKDIEMAETIIKKLKEQDQKDPKTKMTKLHSFLDLIKKTDQLLATAEKSKKDSDIKAAQNSIDSEKDKYLEKDKKAHQARLDKLKKAITDKKAKEKAEKDKQDKAKAEQEKAQAEAQVQAKQEMPDVETPQGQEPTTSQQPVEQATVPVETLQEGEQTPVDNGAIYVAPEAPTQAEVPEYQAPTPQPAPSQPQAPAQGQPNQPATGGGGHGVMTQEEGNKAAEEASHSDWSEFFPK